MRSTFDGFPVTPLQYTSAMRDRRVKGGAPHGGRGARSTNLPTAAKTTNRLHGIMCWVAPHQQEMLSLREEARRLTSASSSGSSGGSNGTGVKRQKAVRFQDSHAQMVVDAGQQQVAESV